jgi:hypothetical protein
MMVNEVNQSRRFAQIFPDGLVTCTSWEGIHTAPGIHICMRTPPLFGCLLLLLMSAPTAHAQPTAVRPDILAVAMVAGLGMFGAVKS